jgi:hypothetical protein
MTITVQLSVSGRQPLCFKTWKQLNITELLLLLLLLLLRLA